MTPGGFRRRRWSLLGTLVVVAVALAALAGVFALTGGTSADAQRDAAGQTTDAEWMLVAEGVPEEEAPALAAQLRTWKYEYDQDEVAYLLDNKSPDFGEITDLLLVKMLEYRRTCRMMQRALDATVGEAASGRADTIETVMGPQLDRVAERSLTPGDDGAQYWRQLTEMAKHGRVDEVQQYLDGSCKYAFGPWEDK